MHAIISDSPGGPFRFTRVDPPVPTPEQVLIDVTYAHVQRDPTPAPGTGIPGAAGCGRVAHDPVGEIAAGTLVAFFDAQGAYAEQVVVHRDRIAAVPESIDGEVAACMLAPGILAHALLHGVRDTTDGDTMVVTGGGGELGLAVTQLAAGLGGTVFSVVSTAHEEELAYDAGATGVFRYFPDAAQRICEANSGSGVDVVIEASQPPLPEALHPFDLALQACRPLGLICAVGGSELAAGRSADALLSELDEHGGLFLTAPSLDWYTRTADEFRLRSQAVTRAVEDATLRFPIGGVFSLAEADAAHEALADAQRVGSVLLRA